MPGERGLAVYVCTYPMRIIDRSVTSAAPPPVGACAERAPEATVADLGFSFVLAQALRAAPRRDRRSTAADCAATEATTVARAGRWKFMCNVKRAFETSGRTRRRRRKKTEWVLPSVASCLARSSPRARSVRRAVGSDDASTSCDDTVAGAARCFFASPWGGPLSLGVAVETSQGTGARYHRR